MLAQRGELADAIKVEHLWNALGERVPFFLMCGYSAAHFVATATHRALREIRGAHTAVHRHSQDPLATWLLNAAHNAPGASAPSSPRLVSRAVQRELAGAADELSDGLRGRRVSGRRRGA